MVDDEISGDEVVVERKEKMGRRRKKAIAKDDGVPNGPPEGCGLDGQN